MPLPALGLGKVALKELPWGKIILGVIGLSIAFTIWLLWHNLGNAREKIGLLEEGRAAIAQELGVKDDYPVILTKIKNVVAENADRKAALDLISRKTLDAKKRETELDRQLKAQQEANLKLAKQSQRTIDALRNKKASGNQSVIDKDSEAPWSAWQMMLPDSPIIDPYTMGKVDFVKTTVTIQLHKYPTRQAMRTALLDRVGWEYLKEASYTFGYTYFDAASVCHINIVDPQVSYESLVLGHEVTHCFYGEFHREAYK